ncbi:MAG: DUF1549 domain-containing protein, partial [Verrucomicrobiae bacterium]|nr:DUF1549 domain-containing protein [Verrucomicrobiae bacterium]
MKPIVSFMLMMACLPFAAAAQSKTIDYGKDILPILSGNCFECHGPDEKAREADLRLDTAEGAYADLFGAVAVSPGDPENSELIYRINVRDKDEVMPPPDSKKSLTDQEKDLLRRWIKEGGEYDTHWAWKVPAKQPLPTVAKHPVDAWILSRLEQEGLQPSPPADPYMLLRRIYLDLIGMPPNPDEIESFLTACRSDSEKAVTRVIDDLMGRPAFGEKWARHWLDVARYADTNGFEKDKPRDQWVYREWVIKALNEDMPYDEFLIEQLAGDLIPNHTQDQLIASGFMRNGMVNEEGAIIPEQFRIEGIFDRMDCFGKATLGLTLQCAQCHTHKFDPITQDEYYGLFAFFNETYEAKSWIYSDKQLKKISSIQTKVAELENRVKAEVPNWKSELAAWESEQKANNDIWTIWDPDVHIWEGGLNHPEELEDHSILTLGHPTVTGNSVTEGNTNLPVITGIRLEALRHGDQPFRGPGRSYWGTFAISEMKVFAQLPDAEDWTKIDLSEATADFATEIGKLKRYFRHEKLDPDNERTVGPASFIADGDTKTGWAPDRGPILRHTESAVVVQFKDPLNLPEGSRLKVQLTQSHG